MTRKTDTPADPFATMTVTEAPVSAKKLTGPLPLPQSLRDFAEALNKASGALLVSIEGWTDEQVKLFGDTLRSNKAELFPGKRFRVTAVKDAKQLRVALGALGDRKETATA